MPEVLASDGRRLLTDMRKDSTIGDLRFVAHTCRDVVETAHNPNKPTPSATTYATDADLHGRSLKKSCRRRVA